MTEVQAKQAILLQWETGWVALHPASQSDPQHVPFTYTNEDFATDALGALGAWARVDIQHSSAAQMTMGSAPYRRWERRGNVFVQLFAPANGGSLLLSTLADHVRSVLEGYRIEDLNIYEGRTQEGAEEGTRALATVVLPFRYVQTR